MQVSDEVKDDDSQDLTPLRNSSDTQRQFDLVLFGATGFTGKMAAIYIAKHYGVKSFNWAIAGTRSHSHHIAPYFYLLSTKNRPSLERITGSAL